MAILSLVVQALPEILGMVSKLVTDVPTTVGQLNGVTKGFEDNNALLRAPHDADLSSHLIMQPLPIITFPAIEGNAADVESALDSALASAELASQTTYKTHYPAVPDRGSDTGVIEDYTKTGDLSGVVKNIRNDFKIWNIPDNGAVKSMADTIQIQMDARLGIAGTMFGEYKLNRNQSIVWVVAFGEFVISNNKNGLVYAFTAGLSSGFGSSLSNYCR